MRYKLRFTTIALKDIQRHKKSEDKKLLQKIKILLEELIDLPKTGTGKPEKLEHELEEFYSRRINRKHRLIYEIEDEVITVVELSAYSHYRYK